MSIVNVAVLSDTHGLLRREVVAEIQDCTHILHAGDIVKEADLDELRLYGSIYAVRGNNDLWQDGLRDLAEQDLEGARIVLMDLLSNYAGYTGCELILVFDAYRVKDGRGERFDHHNIHVVFTKENETGDLYIERLTHEMGKNDAVRVVTSDGLIRISALRAGVLRMSATEFHKELERVGKLIREAIGRKGLPNGT